MPGVHLRSKREWGLLAGLGVGTSGSLPPAWGLEKGLLLRGGSLPLTHSSSPQRW